MGQAKQRGSKEQRIQQALAREEEERKAQAEAAERNRKRDAEIRAHNLEMRNILSSDAAREMGITPLQARMLLGSGVCILIKQENEDGKP